MKRKKKLTRKERKRLLDAELAERGIDPDARRQRKRPAVLASMMPSFDSGEEAVEAVLGMVVTSEALADEPELAEFLFDPMQSVNAMVEAARELGLPLEDDASSWDKVSEDSQMEVLERVTEKLLTKQPQRQIKKAVDQLVERLEGTRDREKAASAAAVQMFMQSVKDRSAWTGVGLVRAIVWRSLEAGFELLDFVEETTAGKDDISEILRSIDAKKAVGAFESVVKKIPGLRSFLEKEADSIWDGGMEAIESGDLDLELFSPEELMGGANVIAEVLYGKPVSELTDEYSRKPDLTEERVETLIARLEAYITELLATDRLDQMRAQLGGCLDEPGDRKDYISFIGLLHARMLEDDAVEDEMPFLVRTLFMEMRNYEQNRVEELASDE